MIIFGFLLHKKFRFVFLPKESADKVIAFRLKVLELFAKEREVLETKIDNALDVQVTLSDLVRQQKEAVDRKDGEQLDSVHELIEDIQAHESFLSKEQTSVLRTQLDSISENLTTLTSLTSNISTEDEVMCVVCYSCPQTAIWNCVKCDCIVCATCRVCKKKYLRFDGNAFV